MLLMWSWGYGPAFNSFKDVTSDTKNIGGMLSHLPRGNFSKKGHIISADRKISADSPRFPYGLVQ